MRSKHLKSPALGEIPSVPFLFLRFCWWIYVFQLWKNHYTLSLVHSYVTSYCSVAQSCLTLRPHGPQCASLPVLHCVPFYRTQSRLGTWYLPFGAETERPSPSYHSVRLATSGCWDTQWHNGCHKSVASLFWLKIRRDTERKPLNKMWSLNFIKLQSFYSLRSY